MPTIRMSRCPFCKLGVRHDEEANALKHAPPVCDRFKAWLHPAVPVQACPECGSAMRDSEDPTLLECGTCLLEGRTTRVFREVV